MASVFKRTRKRPIPKCAEIVEKRGGKRVAMWTSRGRPHQAELTPDCQAVVIVDKHYTVEWDDWTGERKRCNGGPDKETAERLGKQKDAESLARREGLIDPRAEKVASEGRRPIAQHVAEFRMSLKSKGNTSDHVALTTGRLETILAAGKDDRVTDMSASAIANAVHALHAGEANKSLRTCNGYLRAVKQFSRWCHRDGRVASDALEHLEEYNTEPDRRRQRRVLDPDEFRLLIESAEAGPVVQGVDGPARAMMYILAAWTGFRRRELSFLTARSFDLEAIPATVGIAAAHTKNRHEATQPLHPTVAQRLRDWLATLGEIDPDEPLFPLRTIGGSWRRTGTMMREDLKRARAMWIKAAEHEPAEQERRTKDPDTLSYQNEAGLFADFHAHRHGFISSLGKAGVPLATAQKLARHSDPKLTANIYTHLGVFDAAAAVEKLPDCPAHPSNPQPQGQRLRATGTEDAGTERTCGDRNGQYLGQYERRLRVHFPASPGESDARSLGSNDKSQVVCRQEKTKASESRRLLARVPPVGFGPTTPGLGNRCSIP